MMNDNTNPQGSSPEDRWEGRYDNLGETEAGIFIKRNDIQHIGTARLIRYFWMSHLTYDIECGSLKPSEGLYRPGSLFMLILSDDAVSKIELV